MCFRSCRYDHPLNQIHQVCLCRMMRNLCFHLVESEQSPVVSVTTGVEWRGWWGTCCYEWWWWRDRLLWKMLRNIAYLSQPHGAWIFCFPPSHTGDSVESRFTRLPGRRHLTRGQSLSRKTPVSSQSPSRSPYLHLSVGAPRLLCGCWGPPISPIKKRRRKPRRMKSWDTTKGTMKERKEELWNMRGKEVGAKRLEWKQIWRKEENWKLSQWVLSHFLTLIWE